MVITLSMMAQTLLGILPHIIIAMQKATVVYGIAMEITMMYSITDGMKEMTGPAHH